MSLGSGVVPAQMLLNLANDASKVNNTEYEKNQDRMEKIKQWKRKSWLDFCKELIAQDKRYTLMPLSDYMDTQKGNSIWGITKANGVFGNMVLRRDGELNDVYIVPLDPQLGMIVDSGSKFGRMQINGFPARSMVWPVLRIADELERQYTREVTIERNKHTPFAKTVRKGRKLHAQPTDSIPGNNDSNKLSTSAESD